MLKSKMQYPKNKASELLETIVKNKQEPNKTNLENIKDIVIKQYQSYEENKNNLENVEKSIKINPMEANALKGCYTRDREKIVGKITDSIISALNAPYVSNCPHCSFESAPNTIDHYMPKEKYPEFSILPINLIPMCFDCNNIKGTDWLIGGSRAAINYYFDDFGEHRMLYGELKKNGDDFFAEFRLEKSEDILDYEFDIVKNHFKTYNLLERYMKSAATVISFVATSIESNDLTKEIHIINLKSNIKTNDIIFGKNYWKTSVLEAICNNDEFWDKFYK